MAGSDGLLGLPRGAIGAMPVLMLPAVLGGLALVAFPGSTLGRGAVLIAAIAFGWYLLGGALLVDRVLDQLRTRRALARFRSETAHVTEPVWICDRDGAILHGNAAASAQPGAASRDIRAVIGMHRADADADYRGLIGGAQNVGTSRLVLSDGAVLTLTLACEVDLQLWRIEADAANAAVEYRDSVAQALADDEFESLPVALLRLNPDGHIRAGNAAARALVGNIAERPHLGTILEGPGRAVGDWIADVAAGRLNGKAEMLRLRSADPDRHVQMALAPDPRAASGLIAVLSDASALQTLQAQFVQSQKMQAIGQLAGGVAHDFNNLLTAISGHCDLLMLRRDKADPDFADLDQISQNANRAAALVGQLLAFSRKQTLKPVVLDLRDILADLTHLLNRLVGERVMLSIRHDSNLRPVRVDRRQLEQVIMNLVVNARDAMPAGGDIELVSRNLRLDTPLQRGNVTMPKGDYVAIEVRDQGVGIAPELQEKIFEPFFTTKRTGEGTGLGLSTAYGIVKQTGGFIFCDSVVGEGTSFSIYFPAFEGTELPVPADPPSQTAIAPRSEAGDARATVLLVEDEAPVRAFAARALRLKGYEVLEADSAEAALELLADSRIDVEVFVTDVVMPGMDGPSWVRSALKDRPRTKVVFISGYTEDIFAEGHAPVPNAVFLAKPFSLSELTETVERHLATPHSGSTRLH